MNPSGHTEEPKQTNSPVDQFADFANLFPEQEGRYRPGLILSITFLIGSVLFIPPVWKLSSGTVQVNHWHRTKGKIELNVGPGSETWIAQANLSRHALNAIIAAEDARFYSHPGIDVQEIWASFLTNLKRKRFARGGSTITQQVIKVSLLSSEKTMIRKAREAVGAILVEFVLPKRRILEWYVNLVQFGDGVYGIKEGAWHYFKTKPDQLTIAQSIHLALVLPSPNKWSAGLKARNLTEFGHKRFRYILRRMLRANMITQTQHDHVMATGNFGSPINGYEREDETCTDLECIEFEIEDDLESTPLPESIQYPTDSGSPEEASSPDSDAASTEQPPIDLDIVPLDTLTPKETEALPDQEDNP